MFIAEKTCTKCEQVKPIDQFPLRPSGNPEARCRECRLEYQRGWREANSEAIREYDRIYLAENRETKREYIRQWHKSNPYANRKYRRRFYNESREAHRQSQRRRRARKQGATIGKVRSLATMVSEQNGKCYLCGKRFSKRDPAHMEHRMPISKGGEHSDSNTAAAHRSCNVSKHNAHPLDYAARTGKLPI